MGKGTGGLLSVPYFFFQDNFVHPKINRKFAPEFTPFFRGAHDAQSIVYCVMFTFVDNCSTFLPDFVVCSSLIYSF